VAAVLPGSAALLMAGRYLALLLLANLAWEVAQLRLYTLWSEARPGEIAWAVVHCTVGDGIIGAATLGAAMLLTASWRWPAQGFGRVAVAATMLGLAATVALEWLNVELWRNWAYAAAMPRVPPLGTGLSPLLQWLLLPPLCFLAVGSRMPGPAIGRLP
jgi:hypothetical protein